LSYDQPTNNCYSHAPTFLTELTDQPTFPPPAPPPPQAILEGLLLWSDDSKNRFRLKTRAIVERLVRRCGVEAVQAACPDGDARLVSHIRKQNNRRERRRGGSEAGGSEVRGGYLAGGGGRGGVRGVGSGGFLCGVGWFLFGWRSGWCVLGGRVGVEGRVTFGLERI
jgi:hypothetical protein